MAAIRQIGTLALSALWVTFNAQSVQPHQHNRSIEFPDVSGYLTLVCDFHQHSVFSDGSVWPNIRIQEAARDSVDAISLTEHIEYQPHSADMPNPDRNRAFQLAQQYARPYDLIVVNGSEITRDMPPGHHNAIFVQDANKLMISDSIDVFREARRQGAFVFWNHPNWIPQRSDGVATVTDVHELLIREGLLHGIEVVNDITYSDEAFQIAIDYGLTVMATSDIHGLIDWQFEIADGGHRPVTLVFAEEQTEASIKEALFAGRTVGWFNNTLIGLEQHLLPLLQASVEVVDAHYIGASSVLSLTVNNMSDAGLILVNRSDFSLHDLAGVVTLHPMAETTFQVKTLETLDTVTLQFEVMNAQVAPEEYARLTLPVVINE